MTVKDADFEDAAFQAEIEALRQHFLKDLPARRLAFAKAWQGCIDEGGEASWLGLRDVAHRLSGSAPCYGLEALGDAARELDRLLSGRPPCREGVRAEAAVMRVQALLDASIPSG